MTQLDDESDSAGATIDSVEPDPGYEATTTRLPYNLSDSLHQTHLGLLLQQSSTRILGNFALTLKTSFLLSSGTFPRPCAHSNRKQHPTTYLTSRHLSRMPPPTLHYASRTTATGFDPSTLSDNDDDDDTDDARSISSSKLALNAPALAFTDGVIAPDSRDLLDWKISRIGGRPVSNECNLVEQVLPCLTRCTSRPLGFSTSINLAARQLGPLSTLRPTHAAHRSSLLPTRDVFSREGCLHFQLP